MKPGDEKPSDAADQSQDDDDLLDFELEDVLDMETSDTPSASAIEGVEMLDFLDDDAEEVAEVDQRPSESSSADLDSDPIIAPAPRPPAPAAPEMTIDFSPDDMAEAQAAGDDEITNLDEFMPAEEVSDEGDEIVEAESPVAEVPPTKVEAPIDEVSTHDTDVEASPDEATSATDDDDIADFLGDIEPADETDDAEVEDTFAFRDDDQPAEAPKPSFEAPAAGAVTAAQFSDNGGKAGKRRSKMPMILSSLFAVVLLGGGVIAGLFFAGLLPGFRTPEVVTPVPAPPTVDPAVAARNKQINEAEQSLRLLYQASKSADGIDGEKLTEARQIIATLPEDVLAEEPVQEHVKRFEELAVTYAAQQKQQAEEERRRKFLDFLALAELDAPKSIDIGMLEEARKLATEDELATIAELEQTVADYQAEQARLAKVKMEQEKVAMFRSIVDAVAANDATEYGEAIAAYVSAYPEDARTPDLQVVAESDPPALAAVTQWNQLLADWSVAKTEELSEEQIATMIAAAETQLAGAGGALPGAAEVQQHLTALKTPAPPAIDVAAMQKSLSETFAAPANAASFVFAKSDGERYYTAEKPAKQGDNYLIVRLTDLAGKTEPVELAPGDADRTHTGATTIAATSQAVAAEIAKLTEDNVADTIIAGMKSVVADAKLDPVIKTQWLVALASADGASLKPLQPFRDLQETGVGADFNWTDPAAAQAVRAKCAAAIAALPKLDDVAKQIGEMNQPPAAFSVATRMVPIGVLNRNAETETWHAASLRDPPQSAEVFVFTTAEADGFARTVVGEVKDGAFSLHADVDPALPRQGRIIYAVVAAK